MSYKCFSVLPAGATPQSLFNQPLAITAPLLDNSNSLACDFEDASHPICDFVLDDLGAWTRVNASNPPTIYNPMADNTLKNSMYG